MRSPFARLSRHRVEDHLDRELGVLGNQLRKLRRQAVDQLRFGHRAVPLQLVGLVVELGLAAARRGWSCPWWRPRSRRFIRCIASRLLGVVLGLDRQVDAAVLAVDVDDHRRRPRRLPSGACGCPRRGRARPRRRAGSPRRRRRARSPRPWRRATSPCP